MDHGVAHRASLVFGCLVVGRTGRPLRWERVTLQAQQVHLAHAQVARVIRAVWGVTTGAALSLDRYVLIDEGTLFFCVALDANRIPARHRPYLPQRRGPVHIVAITALNQAFVYSVVIGSREVSLGGHVTPVAEIGRRLHQKVLRIFRMVWRVAVEASDIIASVHRC